MQKAGISTACFYPLETEKSFDIVCESGCGCTELFFNSPSEISADFIKEIRAKQLYHGIDIVSIHPFMSFAESFFLFSSYERRFHDIYPLYERYFEIMNELAAKICVIHGSKIPGSIPDELYFERFARLTETGKQYGVSVCQENVVNHRGQSCEYLRAMADFIGEDFGIVLDIKQARRAGTNPYDIINYLHKNIKHIHISDFNSSKDCIPPLKGQFDFAHFFNTLKAKAYKGDYIIELYEHSYENTQEIFDSYAKICKLLID